MPITRLSWWRAAGARATHTALAALLPLVYLLVAGDVSLAYTASIVALAALASLATSLAGLPEAEGREVPRWRAVLVRVLKTVGQVAVPVLGSAVLLQDVGWRELAVAIAGAALTTLVRSGLIYLPEDPDAAQERERLRRPRHRAETGD